MVPTFSCKIDSREIEEKITTTEQLFQKNILKKEVAIRNQKREK